MISIQNRRLQILGSILFVLSLVLIFQHAKAATPCIDYSIGSTQYNAASVAQTPTTMTFSGWHIGACGVTPPPPPIANQLTRASVRYVGHDAASTGNVDMTVWNTVWGRIMAAETGWAWPASRGSTPQFVLGRTQFTCTKFRASNTIGLNLLSMSSYNTAGNLGVSISRTCGDFSLWSATTPNPSNPAQVWAIGGTACHKEGVGAYASSFFQYVIGPSTASRCGIAPNTDYYLNLHWTDGAPTGGSTYCSAIGCKVAVTSNTSPN